MIYARTYKNIHWAPYGVFKDWAQTVNTTPVISSWDISLRPDWIGAVWDLSINGQVVAGFQSPSVALGALWGYYSTQTGETSETAFETFLDGVGNPTTWSGSQGTLTSDDSNTSGGTVTASLSGYTASDSFPGADNVVFKIQQYDTGTKSWSDLTSGAPTDSLSYTLTATDVGKSRRVLLGAENFMPIRFLPVNSAPPPTEDIPLNVNIEVYGSQTGPHGTVAAANTNFGRMTWITWNSAFLTNVDITPPFTGDVAAGNDMTDQARLDAYVDMVVNVTLESCTANSHVDGNPICIDPEDLGFDKAFMFQDVTRAYYEVKEANGDPVGMQTTWSNLGPYNDSDTGWSHSGTLNSSTDWTSDLGPRLILALREIRDQIRAVYPNSPVGWYSVGPSAFWLTGWNGFGPKGQTALFYEQCEHYFDQNIAKNPDYFGWQALDEMDFSFNSYYPSQEADGRLPFLYFNTTEQCKNFFYMFIEKFGPNNGNAVAAAMGAKMMVGISTEADVMPGETVLDLDGELLRWIDFPRNNANLNGPDTWEVDANFTYGPYPTAVASGADSPFLPSTPVLQSDLIKWMFGEAGVTDAAPAGFQTHPGDAGINAQAGYETKLPDTLRDFKVAIWTPYFKGTVSDGINTFKDSYTALDENIYFNDQSNPSTLEKVRRIFADPFIALPASNWTNASDVFGAAARDRLVERENYMINIFRSYGDAYEWYDGSSSLIPNDGTPVPSEVSATFGADGWDLQVVGADTTGADGDSVFDYTKAAFTLDRTGYDSNAQPTTVTIPISMTDVVMQAYPAAINTLDTTDSGATFTERASLNKWVYSTDTITGNYSAGFGPDITQGSTITVTNNSTVEAPKVIANWAVPTTDYEHGDELECEIVAAHYSASNGDMGIACVGFTVEKTPPGGLLTQESEVLVSTLTTKQSPRTGQYYGVFRHTYDISGDPDGTAYTVKATVYPKWGDAYSTEFAPLGNNRKRQMYTNKFWHLLRWKDSNSGGIPTLYVNESTGLDSNPGTSGSPFKTVYAALRQLNSLNGGGGAGNENIGGIIRVQSDLKEISFGYRSSLQNGETLPLKIMADGGRRTILGGANTNTGGSNAEYCENCANVIFQDLDFDWGALNSGTMGNDSNSADVEQGGAYLLWGRNSFLSTPDSTLRVTNINCTYNFGSTNSNNFTFVYCTIEFFDCENKEGTLKNNPFVSSESANDGAGWCWMGTLVGNKIYSVGGTSQASITGTTMVGNMIQGGIYNTVLNATGFTWGVDNPTILDPKVYEGSRFTGWNMLYQTNAGSRGYMGGNTGIVGNLAVLNNYCEHLVPTGSNPSFYLYADNSTQDCDNILMWNNTNVGQRSNLFYNSIPGTGKVLSTNISIHGNLMGCRYTKGERFNTPEGDRVGNWGVMYSCDSDHNAAAYLDASNNAGSSFDLYYAGDTYWNDNDNNPVVFFNYWDYNTVTRQFGDDATYANPTWPAGVGWSLSAADAKMTLKLNGNNEVALGAGSTLPPPPVAATGATVGGAWDNSSRIYRSKRGSVDNYVGALDQSTLSNFEIGEWDNLELLEANDSGSNKLNLGFTSQSDVDLLLSMNRSYTFTISGSTPKVYQLNRNIPGDTNLQQVSDLQGFKTVSWEVDILSAPFPGQATTLGEDTGWGTGNMIPFNITSQNDSTVPLDEFTNSGTAITYGLVKCNPGGDTHAYYHYGADATTPDAGITVIVMPTSLANPTGSLSFRSTAAADAFVNSGKTLFFIADDGTQTQIVAANLTGTGLTRSFTVSGQAPYAVAIYNNAQLLIL